MNQMYTFLIIIFNRWISLYNTLEEIIRSTVDLKLENDLYQDHKLFKTKVLFSDIGLDSLDIMELTLTIEERFNMKFKSEIFTQLNSFKEMADALIENANNK